MVWSVALKHEVERDYTLVCDVSCITSLLLANINYAHTHIKLHGSGNPPLGPVQTLHFTLTCAEFNVYEENLSFSSFALDLSLVKCNILTGPSVSHLNINTNRTSLLMCEIFVKYLW